MKEVEATAADGESSCGGGDVGRSYVILALYRFVSPHLGADEVRRLKVDVESFLRRNAALGAVLLSREGVNGTVCYPARRRRRLGDDHRQRNIARRKNDAADADDETAKNSGCHRNGGGGGDDGDDDDDDPVREFISQLFPGIRLRVSYHSKQVFFRLRVRIKSEIVTMGVDGVDPRARVGHYVKPSDWNDLVNDPECLVVDARNDYEVAVGTFRNAVNPRTSSFPEFPSWLEETLLAGRTGTTTAAATTASSTSEKVQQVWRTGEKKERKIKKVAMFCTGTFREIVWPKRSLYYRGLRAGKSDDSFGEMLHMSSSLLRDIK